MKKILCAIPIPYADRDSFWVRELGLLVLAFNEMGYESKLVAYKTDNQTEDFRPVLQISPEDMKSVDWWKKQQADAVILNLWSAPKYDSIRRAALAATTVAIERLDTSGVRIPRIWPWYSFLQTYGFYREAGHCSVISLITALVKNVLFYAMPSLMEKPMALSMEMMSVVVAESPLAAARIKRHMEWHIEGTARVAQISNPVLTTTTFYNPEVMKENRLVSVGRWDSYQKDFPLLLKAAVKFLAKNPDWSWDLIGKGADCYSGLIQKVPAEILSRIRIHGILPYASIGEINRRAKIHYLASRWEGFCNASIEAMCCGCSYVGPINLAGSSYLIENGSGTIASRRTCFDLVDALVAEAEAWKSGRRDAEAIAISWKAQAGYKEVAEKTLQLIHSLKI
jgi:glycosyltransferase involved in cell wall biosynthesis